MAIPQSGSDNLSPPSLKNTKPCQEGVTPRAQGSASQTLPLTTKEPPIKQTTTTTANIDIKWPSQLSEKDKRSIKKLVVGTSLEVTQELLDEIADKLSDIKRPVSYFYTLLEKHKQDSFFPSGSNQIKKKREFKQETETAIENAKVENIKRLQSYGIEINE